MGEAEIFQAEMFPQNPEKHDFIRFMGPKQEGTYKNRECIKTSIWSYWWVGMLENKKWPHLKTHVQFTRPPTKLRIEHKRQGIQGSWKLIQSISTWITTNNNQISRNFANGMLAKLINYRVLLQSIFCCSESLASQTQPDKWPNFRRGLLKVMEHKLR